jgi:hypothetical protein
MLLNNFGVVSHLPNLRTSVLLRALTEVINIKAHTCTSLPLCTACLICLCPKQNSNHPFSFHKLFTQATVFLSKQPGSSLTFQLCSNRFQLYSLCSIHIPGNWNVPEFCIFTLLSNLGLFFPSLFVNLFVI